MKYGIMTTWVQSLVEPSLDRLLAGEPSTHKTREYEIRFLAVADIGLAIDKHSDLAPLLCRQVNGETWYISDMQDALCCRRYPKRGERHLRVELKLWPEVYQRAGAETDAILAAAKNDVLGIARLECDENGDVYVLGSRRGERTLVGTAEELQ